MTSLRLPRFVWLLLLLPVALLAGVPVIPHGKKMEGQFFPLLYDPTQSID